MGEQAGILYYGEDPGTGVPPPGTILRPNGNVYQYSSMYMSSPVGNQQIGYTFQDVNSPDVSHAYQQYRYDSGYVTVLESEVMDAGRGYIETINGNGTYDQEVLVPYDQEYSLAGLENIGTYTVSVNNG